MDNIIYACSEHIEMAIDDFVNSEETAPEISVSNDKDCSYCNKKAEYKISK